MSNALVIPEQTMLRLHTLADLALEKIRSGMAVAVINQDFILFSCRDNCSGTCSGTCSDTCGSCGGGCGNTCEGSLQFCTLLL